MENNYKLSLIWRAEFNKMHLISMINIEKQRALKLLCIISHKFQIQYILLFRSHDAFGILVIFSRLEPFVF